MSSLIVLILIGFVIGMLGTLVGAGGGFILMPILLLAFPELPADVATAISMSVVATNAISGSIAYAKSKRIDYKAGIIFALFTIPGSIAGVFATQYIPMHIFNIIFGILLITVASYLFITNNKRKHHATASKHTDAAENKNLKLHKITDNEGNEFAYSYNQTYGIIISIFVGFLSPLLGIGGGIIHVPAMVQLLGFPVYIATATSHFILAIMSTVSVIVHLFQGSYEGVVVQKIAIGFCLGVIPGAQVGALLSHKVKTHIIIRVLAVCMAIVGLRIIMR